MVLGMADRLTAEALAGRQPPRPHLLAGRVLNVFLDGARNLRT
jgi:hypothetical protein